jgi:hypothetical protein
LAKGIKNPRTSREASPHLIAFPSENCEGDTGDKTPKDEREKQPGLWVVAADADSVDA